MPGLWEYVHGDPRMSDLERFESPRQHIATFETDELTALCPFDFGGPDHYTLTLRYRPGEHVIESKSLKQYLETFRDVEIAAEGLAVRIHNDVCECIDPASCYVRLDQARRGGIEETVEVGDLELRD
jgi:7-cyano-7-deazaguanine reductase